MGDRILAVNGTDMSGASHQEAVMALLNPPNEIVLTVRHDPQPKGLKVCRPLVFSLRGRENVIVFYFDVLNLKKRDVIME